MRRYWISPQTWSEDSLAITGDTFHHIFVVCRTEVGERFEVMGDDQNVHLVEVKSATKKSALVAKVSSRKLLPLPKPELHLCLSVPRPQILPLIIEKSVELGVHSIHLFYSDHSYFKAKDKSKLNWTKFEKVVTQALQQSGRGQRLELQQPVLLGEKLAEINRQPNVQCLFPYEGASTVDLKKTLMNIKSMSPDKVFYFIGSEGGFSESEVTLFEHAKISAVSLGEQVLRVETACVAVTSVLKYELELMKVEGSQ